MQDAGNTSMSDLRRRYHIEPKTGVKDEWRSMIHHQHELNLAINQQEKDIKKLKQEDLGKAYDAKRVEEIQVREAALAQKREEAYRIQSQFEAYKQDMAFQKEGKEMLKNHLADHYSNHINAKHQEEAYRKDLNRQVEQQIVENAKRRQEEAQRRELAKQEEQHHIFNDEIKRAEAKNQRLLEDKIKEKLDYRDNIRENEKRQILKEENYRNFFKLSVENQKKLMDLHAQNVLNPQLEKNANLEHIVENRVHEERERRLRDEVAKSEWRANNLHYVSDHNRTVIDHHGHIKDIQKQEKVYEVQDSLKKSMEYQDFLTATKNAKKDHQKTYKEFLDRQKVEQEERERMNKMTKHEKKLNVGDLHSYKGLEGKMYGLVPGFLNSKYDHPLGGAELQMSPGRRNNTNIYAEKLAAIQSTAASKNNFNQDSPSKYNLNNSQIADQSQSPVRTQAYEANYQSAPVDQGMRTYTNMNKNYELRDTSPNYRSMTQMNTVSSPVGRTSHNPITNPLPYNNQNPYIAREINTYAGNRRQPYFAGVATSNLLG